MEDKVKKAKALIKDMKSLMGKLDSESETRRNEISAWFKENNSPETEEIFSKFVDDGLSEIEAEVEDIRHQMEDKDYRLLPIGVIAEEYFGKSRSWLSQRINGTKVRGKSYTLNEEQKALFNRAIKEIAARIGSFQIA